MVNNSSGSYINVEKLVSECITLSSVLQLIRQEFTDNPKVVKLSLEAEDVIFQLTEQMQGVDIKEFASHEIDEPTSLHCLFWDRRDNG